jgi:hypothetical protein
MKKFNELTKIELEDLVNQSNSLSNVLRKLNLPINHGNFRTLKRYCNIHSISIDNILNNNKKYASPNNKFSRKYELFEILISGSTYANIACLKERLFNEGLKERKCEKCGQDEWWYNEKITLILDHINGIHNDHSLKNLRILCPNCNATLPTNGGKNVKYKKEHYQLYINNKIEKQKNICIRIKGVPEKLLNARKRVRIIERPEFDVLLNDIFELGYSGTGRKYGVSDNTIRKWKKYFEKYE